MTDADVDAVYAYIMSEVEPVRQATLEPTIPFPLNLRFLQAGWGSFSSITAAIRMIRRNRRNGTAAPIWSKGSPIAAPAIRRATRSGPKSAPSNMAARWSTAGPRPR
ncbi:hypothetical protein QWZ10_00395 [Paracoccus cavernae]|nr:hypothetical protein [Paracoccus cavernae]